MIRSITFSYTRFPAIPSPIFPNRTYIERPAVQTTIEYQGQLFPQLFFSIIDSGADKCTFPSIFGTKIGINVHAGGQDLTVGTGGSEVIYYHPIKVYVQIQGNTYSFECFGGFLDSLDQLGYGLLGHRGFFDLFESVMLDSKRKIVELKVDDP